MERRDGEISPAERTFLGSDQIGADLLAVDWASTPLGPLASWPQSLIGVVRTMLRSRFAMWMAWGDDLTFLCNDAYRRDTLGMKYPWALGRPAREVWAEIWDDIGPRIAHVLETGDATWDEALQLFLERSGYREETYHTFSYSPLADDDGTLVGMLCVVAEETERVIGERRMSTLNGLASSLAAAHTVPEVLATASRQLALNQQDMPFALVYLVDADGAGAQLASVSGAEADDPAAAVAVGDGAADGPWPWRGLQTETRLLLDTSDPRVPAALPRGAWEAPVEIVLLTRLPAQGTLDMIGALVVGLNPHRPPDEAYVAFVELVGGQIASAIASARAYETERLRAERLAELDQAKTMFFTNVSHELRTPLTLMLGPLRDALDDAAAPLPPEHVLRVDLALRNGRRLLALVNSLLDFSRLQDGRLPLAPEPVDLAAETAELAGMFRSAIEAGGLRLVVDCPPLGRAERVDRRIWEQVVTNLVSNAFKHTFSGQIEVVLRGRDDGIELRVADTGEGIPDHELPRVFDRFHRIEGARARSAEGSGIGLALVRELVALHGGTIGIASRLAEGTTVTVRLPTLREHGAEAPVRPVPVARESASARVAEATTWVAPPAAEAEEAEWSAPGGDGEDSRVLVVDDNADMRSYLTRLLRGRYRVRAVADGAQALACVRAELPDLVLCDVMMPVMDGFELVRRLRAETALRDVPVVLLSARAGPEAAVAGLDLGADDYLVKPFTADDLLGRVRARLTAGRERRQQRSLADLAERLGRSVHVEGAVRELHGWARGEFGTFNAILALLDDDERTVRFWRAEVLGAGIDERYAVATVDGDAPTFAAIRECRTIVLESPEAMAEQFGAVIRDLDDAGIRSTVVAPLVRSPGIASGCVCWVWASPRRLMPWEVDLFERAAALVRDTVERLRAAELEHRLLEQFQERLLEIDLRTTAATIAVRYQPADDAMLLGGDWYDILTLEHDRIGISVGDVVGKGLSAATVMGQLRSALGAAAATAPTPEAAVAVLDSYARRLPDALGTTLAYLVLDPDGSLRWCRAGHPPPLLVADGAAAFLEGAQTAPLAAPRSGASAADPVQVPPCGLLLVYTDGLVERRREIIDEGLARLSATVLAHAHLPVGQLCDAILVAMRPEDGAFNDDVALVAVRRPGATSTHFVDIYRSAPVELAGARSRLRAWLEAAVDDRAAIDRTLLAVGEASANAIEHGRRRRESGPVAVEASLHGTTLRASISDTGQWRRDSSYGPARGRGRGFMIMRSAADDVRVERGRLGTTVHLRMDVARVE